jgi:hypothetical protein
MFVGAIVNCVGHTILCFSSISLAHYFNIASRCTTRHYLVPQSSKMFSYSIKTFILSLVDLCCHLSQLSSCLIDFLICPFNGNYFLFDLTSILVELTPRRSSGLSIRWHYWLVDFMHFWIIKSIPKSTSSLVTYLSSFSNHWVDSYIWLVDLPLHLTYS